MSLKNAKGRSHNLSYTAYTKWARCQRKHGFAKHLGLPDPSGPAARKGIILHNLMDYVLTNGELPEGRNAQQKDVKIIMDAMSAADLRCGGEGVRDGWKSEESIVLSCGPMKFKAKIDVHRIVDDVVHILDWKFTGDVDRRAMTPVELGNAKQALAYAYAAAKKNGLEGNPVKITFVWGAMRGKVQSMRVDATLEPGGDTLIPWEHVAEAWSEYEAIAQEIYDTYKDAEYTPEWVNEHLDANTHACNDYNTQCPFAEYCSANIDTEDFNMGAFDNNSNIDMDALFSSSSKSKVSPKPQPAAAPEPAPAPAPTPEASPADTIANNLHTMLKAFPNGIPEGMATSLLSGAGLTVSDLPKGWKLSGGFLNFSEVVEYEPIEGWPVSKAKATLGADEAVEAMAQQGLTIAHGYCVPKDMADADPVTIYQKYDPEAYAKAVEELNKQAEAAAKAATAKAEEQKVEAAKTEPKPAGFPQQWARRVLDVILEQGKISPGDRTQLWRDVKGNEKARFGNKQAEEAEAALEDLVIEEGYALDTSNPTWKLAHLGEAPKPEPEAPEAPKPEPEAPREVIGAAPAVFVIGHQVVGIHTNAHVDADLNAIVATILKKRGETYLGEDKYSEGFKDLERTVVNLIQKGKYAPTGVVAALPGKFADALANAFVITGAAVVVR